MDIFKPKPNIAQELKFVKKPVINLRKPYDCPTLIKHKNSQGGQIQPQKFSISGDNSRHGYAPVNTINHGPGY